MNLTNIKGMRVILFIVIGLIGFLQAVQPMIPSNSFWTNIVVMVISILGIIKGTYYPSINAGKGGQIDTTINSNL